jgi:hypothetical protein
MDELHFYLCPNIPLTKIIERSYVILKQMERPPPECQQSIEMNYSITCSVCQNTNESYMIEDHTQGTLICIGSDGSGCGNLINENLLHPKYTDVADDFTPFELFSPQAHFSSTLSSSKCGFQKLSKTVDSNLNRFGRDDTVTSDHYKDKQRKEAYGILDQIMINTTTPHEIVNEVKVMFHHFRSKMYRIHKLEMALLCLFYIVFNHKK